MRLEFTDLAGPRIARQRAEQDERERYAERHAKFGQAMDAALHNIRIAEFFRSRPEADAYVLAADRADARTEAANRRTQQRREERLERKP